MCKIACLIFVFSIFGCSPIIPEGPAQKMNAKIIISSPTTFTQNGFTLIELPDKTRRKISGQWGHRDDQIVVWITNHNVYMINPE